MYFHFPPVFCAISINLTILSVKLDICVLHYFRIHGHFHQKTRFKSPRTVPSSIPQTQLVDKTICLTFLSFFFPLSSFQRIYLFFPVYVLALHVIAFQFSSLHNSSNGFFRRKYRDFIALK